jgi:adenosylmethionine-8-amino-7-oxononanoate aminotransferase
MLACREAGLLVRALERGIAVSPPLVATETEIGMIGERLLDGLTALQERLWTLSKRDERDLGVA